MSMMGDADIDNAGDIPDDELRAAIREGDR